ncbi:MAG: hypothetical protein HPZ91_20155 [Lentisphaeria bacterium]|nr:hypothetical protein [Lentisphaeria bacterium]
MYKNIFLLFISLMVVSLELYGAPNEDKGILVYLEKVEKVQSPLKNMSLKLVIKNISNQEKTILRPNISHDFVFYIKNDQGLILARSEVKKSSEQHQQNKFRLLPNESLCIEFCLCDFLSPEKLTGKFNLYLEFSSQSYYGDSGDFLLFSPLNIELPPDNKDSFISIIDAMRVAQNALSEEMKEVIRKENTPPIVSYANKVFTVTYPYKSLPVRRGPDFLFRVMIDAKSGKVLSMLGGS